MADFLGQRESCRGSKLQTKARSVIDYTIINNAPGFFVKHVYNDALCLTWVFNYAVPIRQQEPYRRQLYSWRLSDKMLLGKPGNLQILQHLPARPFFRLVCHPWHS